MTRIECEDKIKDKLLEILKIYRDYNPDGMYLTMSILDGHISAHSGYFFRRRF